MREPFTPSLPPPQQVAVAHATVAHDALACFFALDAHCAGLVRRTGEPLLAQMKLAWWRDSLALPVAERPHGEPLLQALAVWGGETASLAEAVSAWEYLVGGEMLDKNAAFGFARERAKGFAGFARLIGLAVEAPAAERAGTRWALADLASHVSKSQEREAVLAAADGLVAPGRLSRPLRPFRILDGLARRSLASGGAPLLGDRGSALLAFRLGLFGR